MRLQGRITRWDDEKGFGFISWHGDESLVFVHIKAFTLKSRRPIVGDIVTYEIAKDKNGKSRAEQVRFSGQAVPKKQSNRRSSNTTFRLLFISLFVCLIIISASFNRISWLIVVTYAIASFITFVAYAWDKSSARLGRWRTAESNLHLMGLVGGWPGALIAQQLLRHKSSKQEFLTVFWGTVFLNVGAMVYLVWMGDASLINQFINEIWQTIFK